MASGFLFNNTTSPSRFWTNETEEEKLKRMELTAKLTSAGQKPVDNFITEAASKSLMGRNLTAEREQQLDIYRQFTLDPDADVEDEYAKNMLSEYLAREYPLYSKDYFYNNFDSFMKQATGYDATPKSYAEHLDNVFKSNASSVFQSLKFASLYLDPTNNLDGLEFQKKKEEYIDGLRKSAANYNPAKGDEKWDTLLHKMITGSTAQAPQLAANLGISLLGAIPVAGPAIAAGGNFLFSSLQEGGGLMMDMAKQGFSDENIIEMGTAVSLVSGVLETYADNAILAPFKKFFKLKPGAQADITKSVIRNFSDTVIRNVPKALATEIPTEIGQTLSSLFATNYALEFEHRHGRMQDVLGYSKEDFINAIGETAVQTALSTPLISVGGSALETVGSLYRNDWSKHSAAWKYTEKADGAELVKSTDIRSDITGIKKNAFSKKELKSDKANIEYVKIGESKFLSSIDDKSLSALNTSRYVYAKEKNFSVSAVKGEESLSSNGKNVTLDLNIPYADAIDSIQKGYRKGEIAGYSLVRNDSGYVSTYGNKEDIVYDWKEVSDPEEANGIAVAINGKEFVSIVTLGEEGKQTDFEKAVFGTQFTREPSKNEEQKAPEIDKDIMEAFSKANEEQAQEDALNAEEERKKAEEEKKETEKAVAIAKEQEKAEAIEKAKKRSESKLPVGTAIVNKNNPKSNGTIIDYIYRDEIPIGYEVQLGKDKKKYSFDAFSIAYEEDTSTKPSTQESKTEEKKTSTTEEKKETTGVVSEPVEANVTQEVKTEPAEIKTEEPEAKSETTPEAKPVEQKAEDKETLPVGTKIVKDSNEAEGEIISHIKDEKGKVDKYEVKVGENEFTIEKEEFNNDYSYVDTEPVTEATAEITEPATEATTDVVEPATEAEPVVETVTEPETAKPEAEAVETVTEAEPTKTETVTETVTEPVAETVTGTVTEANTETVAEAKPEQKEEAKTDAKPETVADNKTKKVKIPKSALKKVEKNQKTLLKEAVEEDNRQYEDVKEVKETAAEVVKKNEQEIGAPATDESVSSYRADMKQVLEESFKDGTFNNLGNLNLGSSDAEIIVDASMTIASYFSNISGKSLGEFVDNAIARAVTLGAVKASKSVNSTTFIGALSDLFIHTLDKNSAAYKTIAKVYKNLASTDNEKVLSAMKSFSADVEEYVMTGKLSSIKNDNKPIFDKLKQMFSTVWDMLRKQKGLSKQKTELFNEIFSGEATESTFDAKLKKATEKAAKSKNPNAELKNELKKETAGEAKPAGDIVAETEKKAEEKAKKPQTENKPVVIEPEMVTKARQQVEQLKKSIDIAKADIERLKDSPNSKDQIKVEDNKKRIERYTKNLANNQAIIEAYEKSLTEQTVQETQEATTEETKSDETLDKEPEIKSSYVKKRSDGLYVFDESKKDSFSRAAKAMTFNEKRKIFSLKKNASDLAFSFLTCLSPKVQDAIIRKNRGNMFLSEDQAKAMGINISDAHGATLIESAQVILSPRANASTIFHEIFHVVYHTVPEFRADIVNSVKEVLKDSKARNQLAEFIKANPDIMYRSVYSSDGENIRKQSIENQNRGEWSDETDVLHQGIKNDLTTEDFEDSATIEELSNMVMQAFDDTTKDGMDIEGDSRFEELTASLFEAWMASEENQKKLNSISSKLGELFAKIKQIMREVYNKFTGNRDKSLPKRIEDAFLSMFTISNDMDTAMKTAKKVMKQTIISSDERYEHLVDIAYDRMDDKQFLNINKDYAEYLRTTNKADSMDVMKEFLKGYEYFSEMTKGMAQEDMDRVLDIMAKDLSYLSKTPTVVGKNLRNLANALQRRMKNGKDTEKARQNLINALSAIWVPVREKYSNRRGVMGYVMRMSELAKDEDGLYSKDYTPGNNFRVFTETFNKRGTKSTMDQLSDKHLIDIVSALVDKNGEVIVIDGMETDGYSWSVLGDMLAAATADGSQDTLSNNNYSKADPMFLRMSQKVLDATQSTRDKAKLSITQKDKVLLDSLSENGMTGWMASYIENIDNPEYFENIAAWSADVVNTAKKLVAKKTGEYSSATASIESLSSNLVEYVQLVRNETMSKTNKSAIENAKKGVEKKISDLEDKINSLTDEKSDLRKEISDLKKQVDSITRKKESAEAKLDKEKQSSGEKDKEISEYKKKLNSIKNGVLKLRDKEIEGLKAKIREMESSPEYMTAKEIAESKKDILDAMKGTNSGTVEAKSEADLRKIFSIIHTKEKKNSIKIVPAGLFKPEYMGLFKELVKKKIIIKAQDASWYASEKKNAEKEGKDFISPDTLVIGKSISELLNEKGGYDSANSIAARFAEIREAGAEKVKKMADDKAKALNDMTRVVIDSIKGIKELPEEFRKSYTEYIEKEYRPGSESQILHDKKGVMNIARGQFLLVSQYVKRFNPALYAYMFGGMINGEYNSDNLNTATDRETENRLRRTKAFYSKVSDLFGVDENDVRRKFTRLFKNQKYTIGSMGYDSFVSVMGNLVTAEPNGRRTEGLYGENISPKYRALAKYFSGYIKAKAQYKKEIETLEKKIEKLNKEKKEGYLEKIAEFNEKIAKKQDVIENINATLEGTNNDMDFDAEYTAQQMMAIYVYAQQREGIDRLLGNKKDGKNVISNNLTIDNILWVMHKMDTDPDMESYRKLADWIIEDIDSRYDETAEVYYLANNGTKLLRKEDMYFPLDSIVTGSVSSLKESGKEMTFSLFQNFRERASVDDSMTHERTGSYAGLDLELIDNYMSAVNAQEHYVAFKLLTDQMTAILKDGAELSSAIKYFYKDEPGKATETIRMLESFLDLIKSSSDTTNEAAGIVARIRNNFTVSKLWLNVSSILQQFPTFFLVATKTGLPNATKYLCEYMRNHKDIDQYIKDNPQLADRQRLENAYYKNQRDQHTSAFENWEWAKKKGIDTTGIKEGWRGFIDGGISLLEKADNMVTNAMWYALYQDMLVRKANDGDYAKVLASDPAKYDAIIRQEATQMILEMVPSRNIKDNALIYSNRDNYLRELLLFTSQLNKQFNIIYGDFADAEKSKEFMKRALNDLLVMGLVSSSAVLISGFPYPSDDEEDKWSAFFGQLALGTFVEMAGTTPVVGSVVKDVLYGNNYAETNIASEIFNLGRTMTKAISGEDLKEGQLATATINFLAEGFTLSGLPSTFIQKVGRTVNHMIDSPSLGDLGYIINTRTGEFTEDFMEF